MTTRIGYRNRSAFDLALRGAILEIEQPDRETCSKIGFFAGVIYPTQPWPDPPLGAS